MYAHTTSQVLSSTQPVPNDPDIQKAVAHFTIQKAALITVVAWYFCIFKSIKGNPNRTHGMGMVKFMEKIWRSELFYRRNEWGIQKNHGKQKHLLLMKMASR